MHYGGIVLGCTLLVCLGDAVGKSFIISGSAKAQTHIHSNLVSKVFAAPMTIFFEVTPIGTILNRFSKDIGVVDKEIFIDLQAILILFFVVFSSLSLAVMSTPMILPAIFLFLFSIYFIYKEAESAYQESYRQ